MLLGGHAQLLVEGAVPDLLHVVPAGDNAMLHGVLEGQDAPLALVLVAHVGVLLAQAHQHTQVSGLPDDGREHGSGGHHPQQSPPCTRRSQGLCREWRSPLPLRWVEVDGEAAPRGNVECRPSETALFSFLTRE